MTVMTESKMARDSYVVLFRHTSADTTGIADTSTQAVVLRNVGGSTIASSSEGCCKFDNSDHIGFLVGWACTALSTGTRYVTVESGDAWRGDVGDLVIELTPTSSGSTAASQVKILAGPYESARFALVADNTSMTGVEIGQNYIQFSITSDASSNSEAQYVQILPFRWPDVQYDT
jgi:hypothetical protein